MMPVAYIAFFILQNKRELSRRRGQQGPQGRRLERPARPGHPGRRRRRRRQDHCR
ncbi:MAG: hypothetical protein M0C28_42175 [Candidatus Moduliflexus flocculans]|nr:hypothetical protein [Candidatus Moduliflexus flocculans]